MNAVELIESLGERGIEIIPDGGNLRIKFISDGMVTDEEKMLIKKHKNKILLDIKPYRPCHTCSSHHFWIDPTGVGGWRCWGCTEPDLKTATTLCIVEKSSIDL